MPRSSRRPWVVVTLFLALLIAGSLTYLGWRQSVPGVSVRLATPLTHIGLRTPLTLDLAAARGGVASVEVKLVQGTQNAPVIQKTFDPPLSNQQRLDLTVEGKGLGLREGNATLEVHAERSQH